MCMSYSDSDLHSPLHMHTHTLSLSSPPPSQVVLLMGNYMNAGSRNQQSYGFDLSYLTKLSATKSADQKTTLIHFLANTVENRFADVMEFQLELRNVEEASRGQYVCMI